MIRKKIYDARPDGAKLYRVYSDTCRMIRQGNSSGVACPEFFDTYDSGIEYYETDTPYTPEDELTDTEALNIIMGRDQDEPDNSDEVPEAD